MIGDENIKAVVFFFENNEETCGSNVEGKSYNWIHTPWFEPTTYILSHKTTKTRDQNQYIQIQHIMIYFIWCPFIAFNATPNASKVGVLLDIIKWSGKNLNQPLTLKYADILNILKTSINKFAS